MSFLCVYFPSPGTWLNPILAISFCPHLSQVMEMTKVSAVASSCLNLTFHWDLHPHCLAYNHPQNISIPSLWIMYIMWNSTLKCFLRSTMVYAWLWKVKNHMKQSIAVTNCPGCRKIKKQRVYYVRLFVLQYQDFTPVSCQLRVYILVSRLHI